MSEMPISKDDIFRLSPSGPGTVRVNHESDYCYGESKSLKIERKFNAVRYVCFRCGEHGSYSHFELSDGHPHSLSVGRPLYDGTDFVSACRDIGTWPSEARVWVRKARITQDHIDQYGVGYSEQLQRIVIPLRNSAGAVVGSVQRGLGSGPRYLVAGERAPFVAEPKSDICDIVVLVEDCLSAIRVSCCAVGFALLGTHLTELALARLMALPARHWLVWLDDDGPKVKIAAGGIARRLTQFGRASVILGRREPKLLTDTELSDIILRRLL